MKTLTDVLTYKIEQILLPDRVSRGIVPLFTATAPQRDRIQCAVDKVAPFDKATWPAHSAPGRKSKLVNRFGDYEVRQYPNNGPALVSFETDCECVVNIDCLSLTAAIYLATALHMTATGSTVDVALDRAFDGAKA